MRCCYQSWKWPLAWSCESRSQHVMPPFAKKICGKFWTYWKSAHLCNFRLQVNVGLKPAGIWPSLTAKKLIWFFFKLWILSFNFDAKLVTCVKRTVVLWQGPQENEKEFIAKTEIQNISIISFQKGVQMSKSSGDSLYEKTPCDNQSPVAHKECGIFSEEENGTFFPFWCKLRLFVKKHN